MKKYILLLFPLVTFVACTSHIDDKINNKLNSDTITKVELDSNFAKNINKNPLEIFINSYADSINNAQAFNELPIFLKNNNFDEMYDGIFQSSNHFHTPCTNMTNVYKS